MNNNIKNYKLFDSNLGLCLKKMFIHLGYNSLPTPDEFCTNIIVDLIKVNYDITVILEDDNFYWADINLINFSDDYIIACNYLNLFDNIFKDINMNFQHNKGNKIFLSLYNDGDKINYNKYDYIYTYDVIKVLEILYSSNATIKYLNTKIDYFQLL